VNKIFIFTLKEWVGYAEIVLKGCLLDVYYMRA